VKQSPKLPAEKRRAQLIKAATKIILKKGYDGATTEMIAREAGLTKGALYFHFGNKEDIFFAVVQSRGEEIIDNIVKALSEDTAPMKGLENMISTAIDMIKEEKTFGLEFWQQANRIKGIGAYLDSQHKKIEDTLLSYLKRHFGMKKSEGKSLYLLLHVLFDGMVVRHQCCHGKADLPRLKKDVIKMTKIYLRGR